MSLIQEALRRKQREDKGIPAAPSDLHIPLNPPPSREGAKPAGASWLSGLRSTCYLIIVLGALAGLISLYRSCAAGERMAGSPPAAVEVTRAEPAVKPADAVAPTPEVIATVPAPPVEPPPAPTAPGPAAVETARPPENPDDWPPIKVMGVLMLTAPEESSAMIDSEMIEVGATIRGVRLMEVRPNGALLSFRGEEQFVKIGKTPLRKGEP